MADDITYRRCERCGQLVVRAYPGRSRAGVDYFDAAGHPLAASRLERDDAGVLRAFPTPFGEGTHLSHGIQCAINRHGHRHGSGRGRAPTQLELV